MHHDDRGPRERRLLRLGWPWPLIALLAALGVAANGLSGALVLGGFAALLYGAGSRAAMVGSPEQRWHLVAMLVAFTVGLAAILLSGLVGGSTPTETS